MRRSRGIRAGLLALVAALACAPGAGAATPPAGTLTADATGSGSLSWSGAVRNGTETGLADEGAQCFGADSRPAAASGCDVFALDVALPAGFYTDHPGAVNITATGFGLADLDLYVYKRNADGTRGEYVTGDGQPLGAEESVGIDKAAGSFYVVLTPYTTLGEQGYSAKAELVTRKGPKLADLEAAAPPGVPNVRASRDGYTSHSEPTIAMDPLDHDHLMAGSKMYENNGKYLFKIGTYESHDGGRTWEDQGHLPGYCEKPGECDAADEANYRITSDVTIDFDDEGNAYANVLDAPGGTASFEGFNMTAHIKRPGQPWSGPIVVHDNRVNALTSKLFLDDKNWIAVDNRTDVAGGPNKPRDGKVGTIYICWSFDGASAVPLQQIVVMRSLDGGRTWGGVRPGDNIPLSVSQKTLISGIGCHIAIGPKGEVYATWYDNQLSALMQAKSTDRGASWTPAAPIAGIDGVNEPFAGESFRNLSLPTTAVDAQGTVYVAAASRNAKGSRLPGVLPTIGRQIKSGKLSIADLQKQLNAKKANDISGKDYKAGGDGEGPEAGSDIVMFKSTNGGRSYSGPVRVNQDPVNGDADQFQPWMAVTPSGQVNVMYFDRRNDPANYFIDTYLSRSEDGGRTFVDRRASQRMWDPAVNAPTSVSGKFIGDYQGLVADDDVAIPFWNDTQLAALPETDPEHSPYQEVFSARVPNSTVTPAAVKKKCMPRRRNVQPRRIGSLRLQMPRESFAKRFGPPGRTTRGLLRYCVTGGGKMSVSFSKSGRVQLAVTTSKNYARLRVRRGSSVKTLKRRFGRRVRTVGPGVRRIAGGSSRQVIFGIRRNRISFVGVANHGVIKNRRELRRLLRRAGLLAKR